MAMNDVRNLIKLALEDNDDVETRLWVRHEKVIDAEQFTEITERITKRLNQALDMIEGDDDANDSR